MAVPSGSHPGFAPPRSERKLARRRRVVELIATGTLTISLIVAATAVSMGDRSLIRGAAQQPAVQAPGR